MRMRVIRILAFLIILTGIGMAAYPVFAEWRYHREGSRLIATYEDVSGEQTEEELSASFDEAYAFNQDLRKAENRWELPGDLKERYEKILDVSGTGIIGMVYIPKIGVQVPVYHGDSKGVLEVAAGHMEGSSFPTGEPGSHAVIAAHTGLASAELFSELDTLKEGDLFAVQVLNRTLYFRITEIRTVLPEDVEGLAIDKEKGLVTLVTCTPKGVNTHRLLVTGEYTDAPDSAFYTQGMHVGLRELVFAGCVLGVSISATVYILRKRKAG